DLADVGHTELAQGALQRLNGRRVCGQMHIAALRRSRVAECLREREVQPTPQWRTRQRLRDRGGTRLPIPSSRDETDQDLERRVQTVQQGTEAGDPAAAVILSCVEIADGAGGYDRSGPAHVSRLPRWLRTKQRQSHAASGRSGGAAASLLDGLPRLFIAR